MRETGFDKTYRIGNTTIHIVAAEQTDEERQERLAEVVRVIELIWSGVNDDRKQETL
ncbi:hypothetical protein H2C83_03410 [Thermoactinomyces sp. AMNI-1]|uniref:Uncharacterized protein n=1 Tax=Thermoactinomyces mirandus TaxID=2756294 RepID=A0A7W1XQK8_9BACL|nr:hypothetical protein [Thermoactinomyces mirandus]